MAVCCMRHHKQRRSCSESENAVCASFECQHPYSVGETRRTENTDRDGPTNGSRRECFRDFEYYTLVSRGLQLALSRARLWKTPYELTAQMLQMLSLGNEETPIRRLETDARVFREGKSSLPRGVLGVFNFCASQPFSCDEM